MPTVTLNRKVIEQLIGKKLPTELLKERIAMLGTNLEDINEKELVIELFPNRPDMLSEQGFARSLSSFLGIKKGLRKYELKKSEVKVYVDKNTKEIRPYTVCAIIKNLKLDEERLHGIIQLQEKLHITLCRNRRKIAIGIYPLEHIKPPIYFKALKPSEILFQPLDSKRVMTATQILKEHPKVKEFAHLLEKLPMYAVFQDAEKRIMSLTPIINSTTTGKVTTTTKEIFIETSGFDLAAQKICLNILATAFAEMEASIYSVEVVYDNKRIITPDLFAEKIAIDYNYINKILGITLAKKDAQEYLMRMGFGIEGDKAIIPPYRNDVLHQADLAENIAIAYGYEKFIPELPKISTIAKQHPFASFRKIITELLIGLNLLEANTSVLTNENNLYKKMNYASEEITIENPKTKEYAILRTSLTPSLLEILSKNKHHEYPQNIFEIGTIFAKGFSETGLQEKEVLSCVLSNTTADFTRIKQILDYLIKNLDLSYEIEEIEHPSFIPGRVGEILVKKKNLGFIGEIHPKVLCSWELETPTAVLELNLSELFKMI